MSEHEGEPHGEPVAELRRELEALKQQLGELAQARTPAEKKEAREEVEEAEEDVAAAAKRAGLKPAQYQKALAAARRQAFLDDYGEEIDRRVEERLDALLEEAADAAAAEEEEGEGKSKPEPEGEGGGDGPKREPKSEPPAEDLPPRHPHWSERKVSELFK